MDWRKYLAQLQSGLMGLRRPQAPNRADYRITGPDYMSTRPTDMPAMLSYTPRMMGGKSDWAQGGQVAYQTANTDYDIAMKDMREDAMEHIRDWSTDFPKATTAGQTFKAPALLPPVNQLVGKAPVGDLYAGADVSSIVNLRKRKERGYA